MAEQAVSHLGHTITTYPHPSGQGLAFWVKDPKGGIVIDSIDLGERGRHFAWLDAIKRAKGYHFRHQRKNGTCNTLDYETWKQVLDLTFSAALMGITTDDLPDRCWEDYYSDGYTPIATYKEVVEEEGYGEE